MSRSSKEESIVKNQFPDLFAVFDQDPVNDNFYRISPEIVDLEKLVKLIGGDKFYAPEELEKSLSLAGLPDDNKLLVFVRRFIAEKEASFENFDKTGEETGGNGFIVASTILLALSELTDLDRESDVLFNSDLISVLNTDQFSSTIIFIQPETKSKLVLCGPGRNSPDLKDFEKLVSGLVETDQRTTLHIASFPKELSTKNEDQLQPLFDQTLLPILQRYIDDGKGLLSLEYFQEMDRLSPDRLAKFVSMFNLFILNKEEFSRLLGAMKDKEISTTEKMGFAGEIDLFLNDEQADILSSMFDTDDEFNIWVTDGGDPINIVSKQAGKTIINIDSYLPEFLDELTINIVGAGDIFIGYLILFYSLGLRSDGLAEKVIGKTAKTLVNKSRS